MKVSISGCIKDPKYAEVDVTHLVNSERKKDDYELYDNPTDREDATIMDLVNSVNAMQQQSCMAPFPFMYAEVPITEEQRNLLAMRERQKAMDFSAKQSVELHSLGLEARLEEIRQSKVLFTSDLYENYQGYLERVLKNPKGKSIGSAVISNTPHIKLTVITSTKDTKKYCSFMISYLMAGEKGCFCIMEEDFSISKLLREFANAGIVIQYMNDSKKLIGGLIWNHLLKNAVTSEVPYSTGWNKKDEYWCWVTSDQLTFTEVKKHVKK